MNIDQLSADLFRDEGVRTHAYQCSMGKTTIGVGRNIDEEGGLGLSQSEIKYLLQNDIGRVISELNSSFPWWRNLPDPCQRALANMCFQLGLSTLKKFHLMLMALEEGNYDHAADEALDSKWARQTPNRAARVTALFREGTDR